jgi:hypothetical protein
MSTNREKKVIPPANKRSGMALRENLRRRKEQARLKSVTNGEGLGKEAQEVPLDE